MSNKKTMKFKEAYTKLTAIADEIKANPSEVIDIIEEKLTEATKLHQICKDRINKVEKMLEKFRSDNVIKEQASRDSSSLEEETSSCDNKDNLGVDDDIPF